MDWNNATSALQEFNFKWIFHFSRNSFNRNYACYSARNKLNCGFIWKISLSTTLIVKVWSLSMTGLADVCTFIWCIRRVSSPVDVDGLNFHWENEFTFCRNTSSHQTDPTVTQKEWCTSWMMQLSYAFSVFTQGTLASLLTDCPYILVNWRLRKYTDIGKIGCNIKSDRPYNGC